MPALEELRERVKPEAIVWIRSLLQCHHDLRHRLRAEDHRRRCRTIHIIRLRMCAAEVDCQTFDFSRLVNDKVGEVDNSLTLVAGLVFGVVLRDHIDKECVMTIASGVLVPDSAAPPRDRISTSENAASLSGAWATTVLHTKSRILSSGMPVVPMQCWSMAIGFPLIPAMTGHNAAAASYQDPQRADATTGSFMLRRGPPTA